MQTFIKGMMNLFPSRYFWLGLHKSNPGAAIRWADEESFVSSMYQNFYNEYASGSCFYMSAHSGRWYVGNCQTARRILCITLGAKIRPVQVQVNNAQVLQDIPGIYYPLYGSMFFDFPLYKLQGASTYLYAGGLRSQQVKSRCNNAKNVSACQ